jgi:tRNA(Ile)-lysidine synthase
VVLAETGHALSADIESAPERPDASAIVGNGALAVVRGDLCRGQLSIRNRRPGDRFQPVGLGGRKKLQDFFVDRKVRRADRDKVPIVVDDSDRIVWVAGYGIDEAFRVTDAAQAVLLLRLRQV